MSGRWRPAASIGAVAVVVVGLWLMATGCGADHYSRSLEFTHWHDEETLVLVYNRQRSSEGFFAPFRSQPETVHVRMCNIADDNEITCRHQRALTNMLNQHVIEDEVRLRDQWQP